MFRNERKRKKSSGMDNPQPKRIKRIVARGQDEEVDIQNHSRMRIREQTKCRQQQFRDKQRVENEILLQKGWWMINQSIIPTSEEDYRALQMISETYNMDLTTYREKLFDVIYQKMCSVCGLLKSRTVQFSALNEIFKPLTNVSEECHKWIGYYSDINNVDVCAECLNCLRKKRIPKLSRTNVPIVIDETLSDLNDVERLLISPLLPVTYFWRHKSFGQFKYRGQPIAFKNSSFQRIASKLPRVAEEILIKFDRSLLGRKPLVRLHKLREAFNILKFTYRHPAFIDLDLDEGNLIKLKNSDLIYTTEDNEDNINGELINNSGTVVLDSCNTSNRDNGNNGNISNRDPIKFDLQDLNNSASTLHNAGCNQILEEEFASTILETPVTALPDDILSSIREDVLNLFESINKGRGSLHESASKISDWENMFPCLMPNGNGGPMGMFVKLSLSDWVSYVLKIASAHFDTDVNFLFYTYGVLRRYKITGVAHCKPIKRGTLLALKELNKMSKSIECKDSVPISTLRALISQISFHADRLPGSIADMSELRRNIFTMISEYGPPTFFVTLSAADSLWPETFMEIFKGKMSLAKAKTLSAKERAELIARNPVRVTTAWKKRLSAFMDWILYGKSKPFGKVLHYVLKSEWQSRCSEHAHLLLWCSPTFSELEIFSASKTSDKQKIEIKDTEIARLAETYISTWIPCEKQIITPSMNFLMNTFKIKLKNPTGDVSIINKTDPIEGLGTVCDSEELKKVFSDLVYVTQMHRCSDYCTDNWKKKCKSRFPFQLRKETKLLEINDYQGNNQYRIETRRNNQMVNPYHVGVLNLWRANIDVTAIIGNGIGAAIYLALYTSKIDKTADIGFILRKLRIADENEIPDLLRKTLLSIESSRAVGAAEVTSYLLKYPYWQISSHIIRINTKAYLTESTLFEDGSYSDINNFESLKELNNLIQEMTTYNSNFDIHNITRKEMYKFDPKTIEYFARPRELENLSQKDYIQNWKTNSARIDGNGSSTGKNHSLVNTNGHVCVKRGTNAKEPVILDLRYRISPPDVTNEKWCIGPLVLHVPHRSTKQLLNSHHNFVQAYAFYRSQVTDDGELVFPELERYETDQMTIYQKQYERIVHPTKVDDKIPGENLPDTDNADSSINDYDENCDHSSTGIEGLLAENNYEIDFSNVSLGEQYIIQKPWKGQINTFIAATSDLSALGEAFLDNQNNMSFSHEVLEENIRNHKPYLNQILKGQIPKTDNLVTIDDDQTIINENSFEEVADHYRLHLLANCKTQDQTKAIKVITNLLEDYYIGKRATENSKQILNEDHVIPLICMAGVPGAGKTWVIKGLKKWVELRIPLEQLPRISDEFEVITNANCSDSDNVTKLLSTTFLKNEEGTLGKAPSIAFSGAAAGVVRGHTIHSALGFSITDLRSSVLKGFRPFPTLDSKKREALYQTFKCAKVLFIDEAFSIDAALFAAIERRMRDILNSNKIFGGLAVILSGDPRQMPPVLGKPLYNFMKYVNFEDDTEEQKNKKLKNFMDDKVGLLEMEGYKLYALFTVHVPLLKSVRLQNETFEKVCMAASRYNLTEPYLKELNKHYRTLSELYKLPWLDAVWMLPNWKLVNEHINKIAKLMSRSRGVYRLWAHVVCRTPSASKEKRLKAIKIFYSSSNTINHSFKGPLPFIDLFPGQIINMKNNWCPALQFYNNAKAIVVGLHFKKGRTAKCLSLDEAAHEALENHDEDDIPCEILARHMGNNYGGPSAIPGIEGIFTIPWTPVWKYRFNGLQLKTRFPYIHPANAITCHQAQGATYPKSVAFISDSTEKYYGMANVIISRTSKPENFAITEKVSTQRMQPKPQISELVEKEYARIRKISERLDYIRPSYINVHFESSRYIVLLYYQTANQLNKNIFFIYS